VCFSANDNHLEAFPGVVRLPEAAQMEEQTFAVVVQAPLTVVEADCKLVDCVDNIDYMH
jgi:hypothetical protein